MFLHFLKFLFISLSSFPIQNAAVPAYITECICSPCLFGLFRPAIYLPPQALGEDGAPNRYELLHDRTDIRAVRPITAKEYHVGGSTALLDAVGKTIHKIATAQKNTAEPFRAGKVMFVIITDGEENASREYSAVEVKEAIQRQKSRYGWEFIFLGANMDAVETAGRFGIDAGRAANYVPDSQGTALNFRAMSETVSAFRACGAVPDACLDAIRRDMKKRGGRG